MADSNGPVGSLVSRPAKKTKREKRKKEVPLRVCRVWCRSPCGRIQSRRATGAAWCASKVRPGSDSYSTVWPGRTRVSAGRPAATIVSLYLAAVPKSIRKNKQTENPTHRRLVTWVQVPRPPPPPPPPAVDVGQTASAFQFHSCAAHVEISVGEVTNRSHRLIAKVKSTHGPFLRYRPGSRRARRGAKRRKHKTNQSIPNTQNKKKTETKKTTRSHRPPSTCPSRAVVCGMCAKRRATG